MEFKLPVVGENITSGQIVKIMVAEGDAVKRDQTLLELETEKATIEVPSPSDGVITKILIQEGETVKVGQAIIEIDSDLEKTQRHTDTTAQEQSTGAQENSFVGRDTPARRIDTQEPETRTQEHTDTGTQKPLVSSTQDPHPQSGQIPVSFSDVHASPSVRRLARELGVDIHRVTGTGVQHLITEDDVKSYVKQAMTAGPGICASAESEALPDFSQWGSVRREPMNGIRKTAAAHLTHAWQTIVHVTQFGKADITELDKLRKKYSTPDNKLTITPFIMKVAASALKQFPRFNASIDMTSQEIIYKEYVHLGVAVDTDNGLLVPVVRDAESKSIQQLSDELHNLAQKAREKKLTPAEMSGGCFTITNLGGLGADLFTPVVNWPEAAILGICRAHLEPCYQEAACAPRLILPLALSYDHRIIDGADGAKFMKWICEAIENPFMLEMN